MAGAVRVKHLPIELEHCTACLQSSCGLEHAPVVEWKVAGGVKEEGGEQYCQVLSEVQQHILLERGHHACVGLEGGEVQVERDLAPNPAENGVRPLSAHATMLARSRPMSHGHEFTVPSNSTEKT